MFRRPAECLPVSTMKTNSFNFLKMKVVALAIMLSMYCPFGAKAQLSSQGVTPKEDSVAIAGMRERLSRIRKEENRPTVALVLSGGGAKGAAHVGVLKYIEELDIPVDVILGTSIGGLVGGLYSLGYDAAYIDSLMLGMDWDVMLSDEVPLEYVSYLNKQYRETYALTFPFDSKNKTNYTSNLPTGFVSGLNVDNIISSMAVGYQDDISFDTLPIPYYSVAADVVSGKAKYWTSGSFTDAMRSTMSIPGLFRPVKVDGMILMDGGIRNNFPADLAKEMGADIIIGVDLSDKEKTYWEMNNFAEMIMPMIDMMGKDAFEKNIKIPDLVIKPYLPEYNMMSFDNESMEVIKERGYAEAVKNSEALKAIKSLTSKAGRSLNNNRAVDISMTPVQIADIKIEGVDEKEYNYLAKKIKIEEGSYVGKKEVDHAVAVLFATGSFSSVTYNIYGTEEPFHLVFKCERGPVHRIGVGYRADSEDLGSLIVNLGMNVNSIMGPKARVIGRVGNTSSVKAHFVLDNVYFPRLNASVQYRFTTVNMPLIVEKFSYDYLDAELFISNFHWQRYDMQLGIREEHYWRRESHSEMTTGETSFFVNGRYYSLDDKYYPSRGTNIGFEYQWAFAGKDGGAQYATIDFSKVIGNDKFAFIPSLNTRFILSPDHPVFKNNYIGGELAGRYFPHQIPFVGVNGTREMKDWMTVVDLTFRLRVAKSLYASLKLAGIKEGDDVENFLFIDKNLFHSAAALELGYDSIVGPIKANVHWDSITGKPGVYLSVGFDF